MSQPPRTDLLPRSNRSSHRLPRVDVRLVTCTEFPEGDADTRILERALEGAGLRTAVSIWNAEDVDWSDATVTVIRSTWDYHRQLTAFLDWAASTSKVTTLFNDVGLVRWNSHKRYLVDLRVGGVPTVQTVILACDDSDVRGALRRFECSSYVVKPAVSLDGWGVRRVERDDPDLHDAIAAVLQDGDAALQPYVAEVATRGEMSLVFVDGEASHAVVKTPAPGDFRVQERLGGQITAVPIEEAWLDLGRRALAVLPVTPVYARVDFVETRDGPLLMELELIEPSLFLAAGADPTRLLVQALAGRVDRRVS